MMMMMNTAAMKTNMPSATTSTRQSFTGRDDLLLLGHVDQVAPWGLRGGVMDAWQQIAQALNTNPSSLLTGLTATATRARFFRMVSQRRERQDKMLRRGTSSESEYQEKLNKLDLVIARMDANNEEPTLQNLLKEVGNDDGNGGGEEAKKRQPQLLLEQIQPQQVSQPSPPPSPPQPKPQPQPFATSQQKQQLRAAIMNNLSKPTRLADFDKAVSNVRAVHERPAKRANLEHAPSGFRREPPNATPAAVVIPRSHTPPPVYSAPVSGTTKPTLHLQPQGQVLSSTNGTGRDVDGWYGLANRALALMQSKLGLDRETAAADRECRREEAHARMQEMQAMRDQTNQLIQAILVLANP